MANTFPPKFDRSIRYPAIYNLDELSMPQSDYPLGVYFNVTFPGYPTNTVPTLTYGKHRFDIDIVPMDVTYTTEGYSIGSDYPLLQNKSRILFEIKDYQGNIIFSDYTPVSKEDGFTGYLWIKQDPLRTYNTIQEGSAKLSIVAITKTTDLEWRNKYNTRTSKNFNIDLKDVNNVFYYNESPILMQFTTGSMGSGSGLFIEEQIVDDDSDPGLNISNLVISASKMKTYSGEISRVQSFVKISGSIENPDWIPVGDHPLTSSNYEDDIHENYSQGINTLSEKWSHQIPPQVYQSENPERKIRFKIEFVNPFGEKAFNPYNQSEYFTLFYPNESESNNEKGWVSVQGGSAVLSNDTSIPPPKNYIVASTGAGLFNFRSLAPTPSAVRGGGQLFEDDGTQKTYKTPGGGEEPPGSIR